MDYSNRVKKINEVIEKGIYKDTWQSLSQFETPKWFKDAKFGIFIHWGLYSIPAFQNEWYARLMYEKGSDAYNHHIETYGPHKDFGYKDFIPMFKAEKFNADEWIDVFKGAGAKYIFPVAEHHDGYQMYKSELSKYNTFDTTPNRDIIGELKLACEKEGIKFCTSNHRAEHWFFLSKGREFDSDIKGEFEKGHIYWPSDKEFDHYHFDSEPAPSEEFLEDWLVRCCEIVDNYLPEIMYFDWWIQHNSFKPYLKKFMAYYYNKGLEHGKKVAVSFKHDALMFESGIVEVERGKFSEPKPFYWQTDTAIAWNSWCHVSTLEYKNAREIVLNLIDIVSKNGNLLLNVGPKANGEIPKEDKEILNSIGQWMSVNGEGIYNSKPWRIHKEGGTTEKEGAFSEETPEYTKEDKRFTTANGYIYVHILNYTKGDEVLIKSLKNTQKHDDSFYSKLVDVKVLGYDKEIQWIKHETGLKITPFDLDTDMPICVRVEME